MEARWAVVTAVVGIPLAVVGIVAGLLGAAQVAGYMGPWIVMWLLIVVGPPSVGGFLLVRFLQRSQRAAFGWGLVAVLLSTPLVVTWIGLLG